MVNGSQSGEGRSLVARHPAIGYLIFILLSFAAIEGILYLVLTIRLSPAEQIEDPLITSGSREMYRADGIPDPVAFRKEGERLYGPALIYHPYRWYAMPRDFAGTYHTTDHHGFRNGFLDNAAKGVAFFGGSTMYSTHTRREGAIPGLLRDALARSGREPINFGVGAYGTTAELMTLIEVSRDPSYPRIEIAVFFDGVNEVTRYVERLQDGADDAFYDAMGYPWVETRTALLRHLGATDPDVPTWPMSIWTARKIVDKLTAGDTSKKRSHALTEFGDSDYRMAAEHIRDIYFDNIADITALAMSKGIKPIFILQPTIFDLNEYSPREKAISDYYRHSVIDLGRLFIDSYRAIKADNRFHEYKVNDLTDAFMAPEKKGELFYDYCHVSSIGNRILANRIMTILGPQVP